MQSFRRPIKKVALLGSYIPRQCGIATFTSDLAASLQKPGIEIGVLAVSDKDGYDYGGQVVFELAEQDEAAYVEAAQHLNEGGYDVVSVQHEYGIFGGEYGKHLLALLRRVNIPIITTLHTVLQDPEPDRRAVMDELLQLSERVVVMSEQAISFLMDIHKVCRSKIDHIPHGIPEITREAGARFRESLNIPGPMILTFGLLSPDKGIEFAIRAMPEIVKQHPEATYVVLGATHPNIRAHVGEGYRESLVNLARELNVEDNVRFIDRFVTIEELTGYLGATDIYITPYLNPRQITSGTLAYAVGAGKAVVSTPYWYAQELLARGRGSLVPFRDAGAIAESVLKVLNDPDLKAAMESRAEAFGSSMKWPQVGARYHECFDKAKSDAVNRLRELSASSHRAVPKTITGTPLVRFDHFFAMTDDTGMFQHATYNIPNREHGYCTDDNARALLLTTMLESGQPISQKWTNLQNRFLSFLLGAYNPANGRFRNFMSYERHWLEDLGSEDSHGRACWCLASVVGRSRFLPHREAARELLSKAMPALYDTTSPRTWAYALMACDERLRVEPDHPQTRALQSELARRLSDLYNSNASADWLWFENGLAYCNPRLSQAMIVTGTSRNDPMLVQSGLESLKWLMALQTSDEGMFAPISTDGLQRKSLDRTSFDQQPVEAWASVSACLTALATTGDAAWGREAERAFRWFLGENMVGVSMVDPDSFGCYDGLHSDRVNCNQGAESMLSYLCALLELKNAVKPAEPVQAQIASNEQPFPRAL